VKVLVGGGGYFDPHPGVARMDRAVNLSVILGEASETMTFSIFEWQCPNIHGESLFADMFLIVLGMLFIAGSFARNLKLGRSRRTGIPAPPSARIIIFMIGCLLVFEGTKLILLC
jgi:hypothetical protein